MLSFNRCLNLRLPLQPFQDIFIKLSRLCLARFKSQVLSPHNTAFNEQRGRYGQHPTDHSSWSLLGKALSKQLTFQGLVHFSATKPLP